MTDKLPTINIKGKEYVMVKDRILRFNELYTNGAIEMEIVSPLDSQTIIVKAIVTPDVKNPTRRFVDYSQAKIGQGMINTTSALENASTSACGRALAMMGIGVIESIASADEVVKAITQKDSDPEWMKPYNKLTIVKKDEDLGKCRLCGADNALSLQGKKYCSDKCWLTTKNDSSFVQTKVE